MATNDPNLDRLIAVLSAKPGQASTTPSPPTAPTASDYAKQFGGGLVGVAGNVVRGAGELAAAPVRTGLLDQSQYPVDASGVINAGHVLAQKGEAIQNSISDVARQRLAESTPSGNLLNPSSLSLGTHPSVSGYGLQLANLAGQVAPVLAAGAVTRGKLLPATVLGGTMGAGAAAEQESQRIQDMDQGALAALPGYQTLVNQGFTPDQARQALSQKAGAFAALTAAPAAAAGGAAEILPFTGKFQNALGRVVGTSRLARAATGAVTDALSQGAQAAGQTAAQTLGANLATGENRSVGENTFQAALIGAAGGLPLGAAAGALHAPHESLPAEPNVTAPADNETAPVSKAADTVTAPPAPVVSTPAFSASQQAETGAFEVAPGITVHQNDGALSNALVQGAKQGAFDRPPVMAMTDGSVVHSETGELLSPPASPNPQPPEAGQGNGSNTETATPSASVPFMLTAQMRRDLVSRGYDARSIAKMTPQDAWDVLSKPATTASDQPLGRPSNEELDTIVAHYYNQHGVMDAQATGVLARRFGVDKQDIADAKRRVIEAQQQARQTIEAPPLTEPPAVPATEELTPHETPSQSAEQAPDESRPVVQRPETAGEEGRPAETRSEPSPSEPGSTSDLTGDATLAHGEAGAGRAEPEQSEFQLRSSAGSAENVEQRAAPRLDERPATEVATEEKPAESAANAENATRPLQLTDAAEQAIPAADTGGAVSTADHRAAPLEGEATAATPPTAPTTPPLTETSHAGPVRSDQGQPGQEGRAVGGRENAGRENLQQPAAQERRASNAQLPGQQGAQAARQQAIKLPKKGALAENGARVRQGVGNRLAYDPGAKETLEQYYKPNTLVEGYGGTTDAVVGFDWNKGNWSVQVREVNKDGSAKPNEAVRTHATVPTQQELQRKLGKPSLPETNRGQQSPERGQAPEQPASQSQGQENPSGAESTVAGGQPAAAGVAGVGTGAPATGRGSEGEVANGARPGERTAAGGTGAAGVGAADRNTQRGGADQRVNAERQNAAGERGQAGAGGGRAGGDVAKDAAATPPKATQGRINPQSQYENYAPSPLTLKDAQPHPGKLVQSAAMAAVDTPPGRYVPNLPKDVITSGKLSAAQLESVMYAGQAHSTTLPGGNRRGYFVGDGTGVGKGREIAGIIMDNQRQGRKKAIWISEKPGLLADAQRDFSGIGGDKKQLFLQGKTKANEAINAKEGVLFTTYATLRSGEQKGTAKTAPTSRVDQIVKWVGPKFDGVIALDEAHNMGNAVAMRGTRGKVEPSAQALMGLELQKRLPDARVVYVSATGATEVANLSYAERLGLWGPGTAFPTVENFIHEINQGGLAAMELVSRDMKQMGVYTARSLSFDGVQYDRVQHVLDPQQRALYDHLANAWQHVLQQVRNALQLTGVTGGEATHARARDAAVSAYWGAQQRFFNQVLTSLQMDTGLGRAQQDLREGRSVVMQLVNTHEAALNRAIAALGEDSSLEDLDLTPKDALLQYVRERFPTQQYETVKDSRGNAVVQPKLDENQQPVHNTDAILARERLLQSLQGLEVPDGPLDRILDAFGPAQVAEITGRKTRIVREPNEQGQMARVQQTRTPKDVKADADAFQAGSKRVLVFSDAGGTGFSFHSDANAGNQQQRAHYLVQPGWRAAKAVQGFGRTHRSNEVNEPVYRLMTTDLPAHQRFISTIARRLDQLGALTKGQRDASGGSLLTAKDNLEGPYASDAVASLFRDMAAGHLDDLPFKDTVERMGFEGLTDKNGQLQDGKLPSVPQFLNRLLSLPTALQEKVFRAFTDRMDARVEQAAAKGTLDSGMETVKALSTKVLREEPVYTDPNSGALTHYVELELTHPNRLRDFPGEADPLGQYRYVQNVQSGRIWGVKDAGGIPDDKGGVRERVQMVNPTSVRFEDKAVLDPNKFMPVDAAQARTLWQKEHAAAPTTVTEPMHLITGTLLPIWDRLRGTVRVARVLTDDGRQYLGRQINDADLAPTLKALGATSSASKLTPEQVHDAVMKRGQALELANGWLLHRQTVNGQERLEIGRFPAYDLGPQQELKRVGGSIERVQWQNRAFLPTGEPGVAALTELMKRNPVLSTVDAGNQAVDFFKTPTPMPSDTRSTVSPGLLSSAIEQQVRKWKNAPTIQVVPDAKALPDYVRQAPGFDANVNAVHDRGAIYLVANRLRSVDEAQTVLAHEVIGHYSMAQILGKDGFNQVRDQIVALRDSGKLPDLFQEIQQRYGELDPDTLAAETLAVMAEKGMKSSVLGRMYAAIRAFLRQLGFVKNYSENDLRALIQNAGSWLETGRAQSKVQAREQPDYHKTFEPVVDYDRPMYTNDDDNDVVWGQSPYWNNASGESSASVEAIRRAREEKNAGAVRMLVDRDGSVRPLYGVDAVDAVAGPGQIIVQRGVGKNDWTVLSRDHSMSRDLAAGRLNAARTLLRTEAEALTGRKMAWASHEDVLPDVVFSKRNPNELTDEIERAASFSIPDIVQALRDKREDWRPSWLGLLTLRQLGEVAEPYLPRIRDYVDSVTAMNTRRQGLQAEAAGLAEKWWSWARKNREEAKTLGDLMHDATLAGVDPAEAFRPGSVTLGNGEVIPMTDKAVERAIGDLEQRLKGAPERVAPLLKGDIARLRETLGLEQSRREAHPALKARYDTLSDEAKTLYQNVRDAYTARAEAMQNALIQRIGGTELPPDEKKAISDRVRAHFESARVQAPYFPLARFGNYWVAAEKNGVKEFRMMENRGQQRRVQEAYAKQGWSTKAGAKIDMSRAIDGASASFMANVANTLADHGVKQDVADEIYQLYLRTLPDLSVRKQFIHRKGVAGYDTDALRAFAAHMNHGSYQLARLEHTHQMEAILAGLRKDTQALQSTGSVDGVKAARAVAEVDKRHQWVMNPKDAAWVQRLSAFNFAYYLGASPASALINMTQGAMTTFPALGARHGWAKALGELTKAMQQTIRTYGHVDKLLTGDELRAHQELSAQGAIDRTLSHDLAGMGEGSVLAYNPGWRRTMQMISHGFHKAEVFNRESAGLAAYRLARQAGETHEQAVKYAADIIYETHFDYSNANRARFMQGNGAKVLFAMKQYSQHMSYYLWRNFYQAIKGATPQEKALARRKLTGTLGMTALFSGAMGMPLMTMMFGTANAFHTAFGDKNEPWDAETEFRNFLTELLGPMWGHVAQTGPLNALTGLELGDRTKLDQLWFRPPDRELEGRAQYDYLLEQMAGPMGEMFANALRGYQLYEDGHLWRGVETALPAAVKHVMKTLRYANEGVNNLRGEPLVKDLSPFELAMQSIGFTPSKVQEQYTANNALQNYQSYLTKRRQSLMDAYAMGVQMKDQDMIQSAYQQIEAFNAENPAIGISGNQIRRALQARAKYDERAVNGVVLNPKLQAQLRARVTFAGQGAEPNAPL